MPAVALDSRRRALLRLNAGLLTHADARRQLLERFGEDFLAASDADWARVLTALKPETISGLRAQAAALDVDAELALAERLGVSIAFHGDAGYPDTLASIPDAPLALYVKGRLDQRTDCAAVVGSRRASAYGLRIGRRFGQEIAQAGLVVVSGLARGVDAAAHAGCLDAGGLTWAVLGSGLSQVYPPENEALAARIAAAGGALVSEAPLTMPPHDRLFPRRNRIISGLSWCVVVVEGRFKSGSLITARCAQDQGREVFAVPGPVDSPLSEAPHKLLRDGSPLAERWEDVAGHLPPGVQGLAPSTNRKPEPRRALAPSFNKVLQSISSHGSSLDELRGATGLDLSQLSTIIFELELQQLIYPIPGQRYAKRH